MNTGLLLLHWHLSSPHTVSTSFIRIEHIPNGTNHGNRKIATIMSSVTVTVVCFLTIFGLVNAIPMLQQQHQPQQQQKNNTAVESGFSTVFWSVMDDCFDEDSDQPAVMCLKSKALTAMDRVLSKPAVTVVNGLTLSARSGKSLSVDVQATKNDRAALDATKNSDQKNALLDDMLFNRMEQIVSTRTIVMDGPNGEEGRGKKKDKGMKQAMMMAGMMAVAVMGPMALKVIALIAVKALLISKIALVLSAITVLKKLMQKNSGGSHEQEHEIVSEHHHGRSMRLDAHDAAYSGQKQ